MVPSSASGLTASRYSSRCRAGRPAGRGEAGAPEIEVTNRVILKELRALLHLPWETFGSPSAETPVSQACLAMRTQALRGLVHRLIGGGKLRPRVPYNLLDLRMRGFLFLIRLCFLNVGARMAPLLQKYR